MKAETTFTRLFTIAARVLIGAATVFAAAAISAAPAGARGRLIFLGALPGERTVQLELHRSPLGRVGVLNVLVRNDSSIGGRLRIRFYPDNLGRAVPVRPAGGRPFPRLAPVLFSFRESVAEHRLRLPPHRLVALQLRLGVAKDALADATNGALVIDLRKHRGVRAAVLRVRGNISQAKPAAPSAQPEKVTLQVTRWWPLGIGDRHRTVANSPRVWVPGQPSNARTLLSSPSDDAEVVLSSEDAEASPPTGLVQQHVKLVGGVNAGTYSGELPLVSGGSDKLSVEAQVRDLFLWPLLMLAITAFIGGYGTTWWQGRRQRDILIAELRRARGDYDEAWRNRPPDSPVEPLDETFPPPSEAEINGAQTPDEIDAATDRVRTFRDAVKRWIEVETAAAKLLAVDIPKDAGEVHADIAWVLAETRVLGDDSAAIERLIDKLRRQERLARAFVRAFGLNEEAALTTYANHRRAAENDTDTAHALADLALVQVRRELLHKGFGIVATDELVGAMERLRAPTEGLDLVSPLSIVLRPEIPPAVTPEQIKRGVRRWDRRLALLVFALTILGFFATLYGSDFGSWTDYAKAAGAGVGSQAVGAAVWSLFPGLRSYRLPLPKKA